MKMADFCYVMLRGLADKYHHFGWTRCLHHHVHHSIPWWWQHRVYSKRLHFPKNYTVTNTTVIIVNITAK